MKKKTTALILALALAMGLCAPALATDQTIQGPTSGGTFNGSGDVAWKASVMTGDVISVVMPTSVDFYIKLKDGVYSAGSSGTTTKGFDLVLSAEAKITNNSSTAIALSCSNVADGGVQSDASPSAGAPLPTAVLALLDLALGKTANATPLSDEAFTAGKLTAGTVDLALGTIPRLQEGSTDNVMSLWMHGKKLAAEDNSTWGSVDAALSADETITATVTTTLKVAVAP